MKKLIKLEAEIDMSTTYSETRVKPIDGDYWNDFGYWLEVTGFMAYQAMKYREWNKKHPEAIFSFIEITPKSLNKTQTISQ